MGDIVEVDEWSKTMSEECDRCDDGWVGVTAAYPLQLVPDRDLSVVADEHHGAVVDAIKRARWYASRSVYPCKSCRPELFYRWAGGHLDRRHDPGTCDECIELTGRRPSLRRSEPVRSDPSWPPERKDLA